MTAPDDEERLRRLAEAATPGPWKSGNDCVYEPTEHADGDPDAPDTRLAHAGQADADFIADVNPHQVLSLLDRLAALRAELAAAKQQIEREVVENLELRSERDALANALAGVVETNFGSSAYDPHCDACVGAGEGCGNRRIGIVLADARAALARLQDGGGT